MGKLTDYQKLHALARKTSLMGGVQALLDWDQETYMPHDAIALRAEQTQLIAGLVHQEKTSKKFGNLLFKLIDKETGAIADSTLSADQIAALKCWRHDYLQAIKIPSAFIKQFAQVTSTASHVWKHAKAHNDFRTFAPHLEKIVSLLRKKADKLGFTEHPYDALLDLYEPGMTTATLTPLFHKLRLFLTSLLKQIALKPPFRDEFLYHHCSEQHQLRFAHLLLEKMGFDSGSSRLDLTVHPFCSGLQPLDTRMTTKIHPENLFMNIGAVLHEGGHGLYNHQLDAAQYGAPLCEQVSLGIDESQSRLWETLVGQSKPFWHYFFPLLQREFKEPFAGVSFSEFYPAINAVKPGFIRIDADEVSYNLHIIIRFEIEKGLIEGSIKVKQIPEVWNQKMRDYLGICPQFDGQGCLQDIHWSLGLIGYFPTYTLGNLYAAQFFDTFQSEHPQWQKQLEQGDLSPLREFLKEKIHKQGRRYLPGELCEKVTGKPLSEEYYTRYLSEKYNQLYKIV